jgi:hypothetical protein
VIERPIGKKPARGEAGMPGPDDDDPDALDGSASVRVRDQRTSTVTFTGFVITSYTAERFCDCATIASMSCFEASASILNVTLTSS